MKLSSPQPGLLAKLISLVLGALALTLGLMFSLLLIPTLFILVLLAWAYLYWKTRKLRKAMAGPIPQANHEGEIIEGEVVVVHEDPNQEWKVLPTELASVGRAYPDKPECTPAPSSLNKSDGINVRPLQRVTVAGSSPETTDR